MHPAEKNAKTENEKHHAELENSCVAFLRWKFEAKNMKIIIFEYFQRCPKESLTASSGLLSSISTGIKSSADISAF